MSLQWHRLPGLGFRPAIRPHLTPFVRSHHNLFRGHRFVQERDLSLRSTSLGSLGEDALHLVGRPTGATWRDPSSQVQRTVLIRIIVVVFFRNSFEDEDELASCTCRYGGSLENEDLKQITLRASVSLHLLLQLQFLLAVLRLTAEAVSLLVGSPGLKGCTWEYLLVINKSM